MKVSYGTKREMKKSEQADRGDIPQALDVHMKDGRHFHIEPVYARTPDGPMPAARLYLDGVLLDAVTADTYDDAMEKAFEMVKARR